MAPSARPSFLPLALTVFLSPSVWGLLIVRGAARDSSLLAELGALAGFMVVGLLALIAVGLWRRSPVALGLALATCVCMVLVGLALLSTVTTFPLVGLASVHLIAAGLLSFALLVSSGTRRDFLPSDGLTASVSHVSAQPTQVDASLGAVFAEAPDPIAVDSTSFEPLGGPVRVTWRDFSPAARVLLVVAVVLAVLAGLSVRVVMNGAGAVSLPTTGSVVLLAASLACGFAAALLARSTRRKRSSRADGARSVPR